MLESFVKRYGGSFYADLARERIEELKKKQLAAAAPPVVPAAPRPCVVSASRSSRPAKPLSANEECALKPHDAFRRHWALSACAFRHRQVSLRLASPWLSPHIRRYRSGVERPVADPLVVVRRLRSWR